MIQLAIKNPSYEIISKELIYLLLDTRKTPEQLLHQQKLLDALKQAEISVKVDDLKLDEIVIEPVVRAPAKNFYYDKKLSTFALIFIIIRKLITLVTIKQKQKHLQLILRKHRS